ncbi:hypothetical protein GB937_010836 [Aspergillus fischeri]|nr:hypothetical protein GB937_010836 [Aspergillus fischeri]
MMDAITYKLRKDLQSPRIVEILQDSSVAEVVNSQVHIPCLAHVLQLAVKELFTFLKVEATNDEIEMVWDSSDRCIHSEGFAATLEKFNGPTVHKAFDIYNSLFQHLEDAQQRLESKRTTWKRELRHALSKAIDKLRQYYSKTYYAQGYVYAIATILAPQFKLKVFQEDSWSDDEVNWHDRYARALEDIYAYYAAVFPDKVKTNHTPNYLSELDRIIAVTRKGKARVSTQTDDVLTEIEDYLQEGIQEDDEDGGQIIEEEDGAELVDVPDYISEEEDINDIEEDQADLLDDVQEDNLPPSPTLLRTSCQPQVLRRPTRRQHEQGKYRAMLNGRH